MRKLSKIRDDLKFYDNFSNLIETCKTIALTEFRALQGSMKTFDSFVTIVGSFFKCIEAHDIHHPFVESEGKPLGVIAVTSDAGLSGGLDMHIAAAAAGELQTEQDRIFAVGRQGLSYLEGQGVRCTPFPGVQDETRFQQAMKLRDYVTGEVLNGSIGPVKVVFARPVSIIVQRVEVMDLLPCSGQVSGAAAGSAPPDRGEIILESSPEDLVEYLVYLWVGQKLFEVFGMSRLAEVAARFMHAEDSSVRIRELNSQLGLEYVRAHHEKVDQQMRELFAARA